jgi:outer membrane lipoprotein SlyB
MPRTKLKSVLCVLVVILAFSTSAHAKGCIKGAAVGGVAGHYAGHHGVLGAAAGCVVGRREAKKHERERMQNVQKGTRNPQYGEEELE